MTTKQLQHIHRGDQVPTPRGLVTVTSMRNNWVEDFRAKAPAGPETITLVGTLPTGQQVKLTAPSTSTLEVSQ